MSDPADGSAIHGEAASVIRQEVPDWNEAQRAEPDCCADARALQKPRMSNSNTHSGVNIKNLDKVFNKILLQIEQCTFLYGPSFASKLNIKQY